MVTAQQGAALLHYGAANGCGLTGDNDDEAAVPALRAACLRDGPSSPLLWQVIDAHLRASQSIGALSPDDVPTFKGTWGDSVTTSDRKSSTQ